MTREGKPADREYHAIGRRLLDVLLLCDRVTISEGVDVFYTMGYREGKRFRGDSRRSLADALDNLHSALSSWRHLPQEK